MKRHSQQIVPDAHRDPLFPEAFPFLDGLIAKEKRSRAIFSVGVPSPSWPAVLLLGGPHYHPGGIGN
jgi:hypothetical protein